MSPQELREYIRAERDPGRWWYRAWRECLEWPGRAAKAYGLALMDYTPAGTARSAQEAPWRCLSLINDDGATLEDLVVAYLLYPRWTPHDVQRSSEREDTKALVARIQSLEGPLAHETLERARRIRDEVVAGFDSDDDDAYPTVELRVDQLVVAGISAERVARAWPVWRTGAPSLMGHMLEDETYFLLRDYEGERLQEAALPFSQSIPFGDEMHLPAEVRRDPTVLLNTRLFWRRTHGPIFTWCRDVDGGRLVVQEAGIDFTRPQYTVRFDGDVLLELDEWPPTWRREFPALDDDRLVKAGKPHQQPTSSP